MGTRADFYWGRGPNAERLGSINWDGHPETVMGKRKRPERPNKLARSTTPEMFRKRFSRFTEGRDDVTQPPAPWPWPWEDSRMTDYAYAFSDGRVWVLTGDMANPKWKPIAAVLLENAQPDDDDSPIVITAEDIRGWADSDSLMATISNLVPRMRECSPKRGGT